MKDKYARLCLQETLIPIYMRDWWLDCCCGADKWNVLLFEKDGNIEAFMTYYQPHKGVISMPVYAQSMGIWFHPAYDLDDATKNIGRRHDICNYFIDRLPTHKLYIQHFPASFTDWLPFYWRGYKQTTRYNYIIPDISSGIDALWHSFGSIKKKIKHAKDIGLIIKRGIPEDEFFSVLSHTYSRQKKATPAPESLLRLIRASRERGQGDLFGAYDNEENLYATVFLAWQESCAYAIAGGKNYAIKSNVSARELLRWETILFASTVSKSYDFQGSMVKGIESFNAKFRPTQVPYFQIYKGKQDLGILAGKAWHKLNPFKN